MTRTSPNSHAPSDYLACYSGEPETAGTKRLVLRFAARWWRAYCRWDDRRRQHRHLAALNDRLLADVGLSRGQARREASRSLLL